MQKSTALQNIACMGFALACFAATPAVAQTYSDQANSYDGRTSPANWSGLYIGPHIGGIWGDMHHDDAPGPSGTTQNVMGGGQIGYNWQYDHFVYGAEADASRFDLNTNSATTAYDEDWMMTFRGRAGYDFRGWLPYATVGLAETHTELKELGTGSNGQLNSGIAAGGGLETMLTNKWSGKIEYLYADVPTDHATIGGANIAGGSHNDIVRVGLNYHF